MGLREKRRYKARAYSGDDAHCCPDGVRSEQGTARAYPVSDEHTRIKKIRIASWNVGSLTGRSREIVDVMQRRKIQIMCCDDPPMSDHSTIVVELDLALRHRTELVRRVRSCWRSFSTEEVIQDIEKSPLAQHPPPDVNALFTLYDETLRSVLNKHTPLKVFKLRAVASSARWYNSDCRSEKVKTRRLERIYRRTKTAESLFA